MKERVEVTPRKSWSPGYITRTDMDNYVLGKITAEELRDRAIKAEKEKYSPNGRPGEFKDDAHAWSADWYESW